MEFEEQSVWVHLSFFRGVFFIQPKGNNVLSYSTLLSVHINKMLPKKQRLEGGSNFHDFWQREEVEVKYLPVVQQLAILKIYFEI